MLKETKILFENLTHFRQLLNEAVGEGTVIDAIKKHKIVYIYYAGDDTIMKGYRTIKPMVLGYSNSKEAKKSPYMLLRAWEEAGNSDSKKMYADQKGRMKYGWRLFRVDKITSFLPTGKMFSTEEGKFPNVEDYNPNDSQMNNIIAAVEITSDNPRTTKRGAVVQPQPSAFDGQREKFRYFSNVGKKHREIDPDELEHLWAIADKIKKKSKSKLMVVVDEHGDMILRDESQRDKISPDAIVGNLRDLYMKYIAPTNKVDTTFSNDEKAELTKELGEMNKTNITKENVERKTFFK